MYYYYSPILYLAAVAAALLSVWAQITVKSRFSRYDRVHSRRNITGAQAAAYLLKANGITDVRIQRIGGNLTDNYNPSTKILSLSDSTYSSSSIAAIGVAAHETGHAIQHAVHYGPLALRSTLVPAANIGSRFGPVLAIIGLLFTTTDLLVNIGLILFSASMLFYLVTLPVEFNASNRALKILKENAVLEGDELRGVRKVLGAAAMTYVAAALTAIINFLRLYMATQNRRKR